MQKYEKNFIVFPLIPMKEAYIKPDNFYFYSRQQFWYHLMGIKGMEFESFLKGEFQHNFVLESRHILSTTDIFPEFLFLYLILDP